MQKIEKSKCDILSNFQTLWGWCKKKKDGKNLCFSGKVMKNYEVALVWYFYAQSPKNSENVFLLRRRVANEGKWECSLEGPTLRLDVPNSPALCLSAGNCETARHSTHEEGEDIDMGQAKEFLMEANDMLCYSNSAKMQPTHILQ